jgi:hypothetical protein
VALLLAPGALGASLKAGGLTTSDRRALGEQGANLPPAASAIAKIMAIVGRTAGFALSHRAPITSFGGVTTFTSAGMGFNGGLTTSFDNFGNLVVNEGGRGIASRRLGEQAAAAAAANIAAIGKRAATAAANITVIGKRTAAPAANITAIGKRTVAPAANITAIGKRTAAAAANTTAIGKRIAAAAANITAIGGRRAGFGPSDGTPITIGFTNSTKLGAFAAHGPTTSFDNLDNPVVEDGCPGCPEAAGDLYRDLEYASVPTFAKAVAFNKNRTTRPTDRTGGSLA